MNGFSMDRRALMQHAMLLLGATTVSSCNFLPGASKPATLSSNEIETLNAFADTLIPVTDTPGALAAGVPKTLAQMFTDWASQKTRDELSGALQRLDDAARKAKGKGFAELSAADRQTFLSGHDKAALVDVPPPPDAPKGNPFVPLVSVVDNGYAKLKELVAVLYYFSEIGLTKELVYEHVPGGWTASVKVTPKTRPAITFGAF
ncbi:gluconate 2-dehydrogenase subunit 3 family protein [Aquisediminimonas profunda]|uniref:gluconate 2-dehydrogenase subunit 3 family protein n=1 Tax=Aquisediminimonas profunda TaxID=1550733 RepID=UPI001C638C73|nr:gluconate 2-dehydrogenase subunit 3 family protein [Aquisediminimonas profunda]